MLAHTHTHTLAHTYLLECQVTSCGCEILLQLHLDFEREVQEECELLRLSVS